MLIIIITGQYKWVFMQQSFKFFLGGGAFEPLWVTIYYHIIVFNKENIQWQETKHAK